MHRVYEIFEVLADGSRQRNAVVSGLASAKARLQELANHTSNECFAADRKTSQIVAILNVTALKWSASKHIFQISYDEQLGLRRAELLKSCGYSVLSVIDNEAAKIALGSSQHYDLFIVGHAASEATRREMIDWLKANYPGVKILSLNPPNQDIPRADYNVRQNGTEAWLSIVSRELANPAGGPASNKASTGSA